MPGAGGSCPVGRSPRASPDRSLGGELFISTGCTPPAFAWFRAISRKVIPPAASRERLGAPHPHGRPETSVQGDRDRPGPVPPRRRVLPSGKPGHPGHRGDRGLGYETGPAAAVSTIRVNPRMNAGGISRRASARGDGPAPAPESVRAPLSDRAAAAVPDDQRRGGKEHREQRQPSGWETPPNSRTPANPAPASSRSGPYQRTWRVPGESPWAAAPGTRGSRGSRQGLNTITAVLTTPRRVSREAAANPAARERRGAPGSRMSAVSSSAVPEDAPGDRGRSPGSVGSRSRSRPRRSCCGGASRRTSTPWRSAPGRNMASNG